MGRHKRILVAPEVGDLATLRSLVGRLGHYLSHVGVHRVTIAVTPELKSSLPGTPFGEMILPQGFDPEVRARVAALAPAVSLVAVAPGDLPRHLATDFLVFWDSTAPDRPPWAELSIQFRLNRTRFDVDWLRQRNEGSWFGELSHVLSRDSRAFDRSESQRFEQLTGHLRGSPIATLVATGPSARQALDHDLWSGVRIACNTTILDTELMDHLQPQIVTFADPIFHFGPSTYAYQFQRALAALGERHDFAVVTLERYANLLRHAVPSLARRVVGVRLGLPIWPQNYDLFTSLAVKPFPNILTMLMLPLARTFSTRLQLFGFDGRDPDETYFWRHGSTVQFDTELEEIKQVHPGFFELDYGDYYDRHVSTVEQLFLDLELSGATVESATPSFMLPLRRRSAPQVPRQVSSPSLRRSTKQPIVSITPDWTGDFGHFGPWERAVGAEARAAGYEYFSLASRGLDRPSATALPVFTHGSLHREIVEVDRFESELRRGLDETAGCHRSVACFYAADVWHLPSIIAVAHDRPNTTFVVNLMRSHDAIHRFGDPEYAPIKALLEECLRATDGTTVHVCVDSDAVNDELASATGRRLPVWPMVMLADPIELERAGRAFASSTPRIVSAAHPQMVKGFPLIVELAERLGPLLKRGAVELAARFAPQPGGFTDQHLRLAARFRAAGGELLERNLSDTEFVELVGNAHVILLPHRLETFRTRTSGTILDALAAGKPVITTKGTWGGDLIERHGLGVTYEDGDLDSLAGAVRGTIEHLERFGERLSPVRRAVVDQHRPQRLLEFFAQLAAGARTAPDRDAVRHTAALGSVAAAAWWRPMMLRERDRFAAAVATDDLNRSRDDAYDQVQLLKLANTWKQRELDRISRTRLPSTTALVP